MGKGTAEQFSFDGRHRFVRSLGRFLTSLRCSPAGQVFPVFRLIVIPAIAVAALTLLIRNTGMDLGIQRAIYTAGEKSWVLGDGKLWQFLYRFGAVPVLVTVVASTVGVFVSFCSESWRGWRRVFIFNILLFVIGPGVVANGILKEYWGRPRPREVKELGGRSEFEPVLSINKTSGGKSFPSGHATMGFYFVGTFFILRRHRRRLSELMLEGGIVLGMAMGVARMAQGSHFLTDVIFSFAVCYTVALGLYYALGLHKGLWREKPKNRTIPVWQRLAILFFSIIAIAAVALGTPFRAMRNIYPIEEASRTLPLELYLNLSRGEHSIRAGSGLKITGDAYGRGIPTSSIAVVLQERMRNENALVVYKERISGWFREVNQQLDIVVPWSRVVSLKIHAGETFLEFPLDGISPETEIIILSGEGEILLTTGGRDLMLEEGGSAEIIGRENLKQSGSGESVISLRVTRNYTGRIRIED
jgi:membrane-associated PAP2 superfamily phosphatase